MERAFNKQAQWRETEQFQQAQAHKREAVIKQVLTWMDDLFKRLQLSREDEEDEEKKLGAAARAWAFHVDVVHSLWNEVPSRLAPGTGAWTSDAAQQASRIHGPV